MRYRTIERLDQGSGGFLAIDPTSGRVVCPSRDATQSRIRWQKVAASCTLDAFIAILSPALNDTKVPFGDGVQL